MDDKGQMLIIELIFFATTVILALIFLYNLSPSSIISQKYSSDLKLIGDNALSALDDDVSAETDYMEGFSTGKLTSYVLLNNPQYLVSDLNNQLPSTIMYNVYLSNTTDTVFWVNSHLGTTTPLKSTGSVVVSHYLIAIDLPLYEQIHVGMPTPTVFTETSGSTYQVVLEMWYA